MMDVIMKIKFNSDDNLPLNKPLKFHNITITIRSLSSLVNYWYFKDIAFKYEPYFCNGCHVNAKIICYGI